MTPLKYINFGIKYICVYIYLFILTKTHFDVFIYFLLDQIDNINSIFC